MKLNKIIDIVITIKKYKIIVKMLTMLLLSMPNKTKQNKLL